MLNIGFFKGQPTDYIIKYISGSVVKEGPGLAFYYLKYRTQVVAVPTCSTDANFVFNDITNNFQSITVQGQFTYRINEARKAASLLNFTIDPQMYVYLSEDPQRLTQRIINVLQMVTHSEIQMLSLEDALKQTENIASNVLKIIRERSLLESLGVELLSVYFVAAKPTPEVSKALEAEYREKLLRKADESIYARRAAAVEEERKIKENELNTQIAIEEQRKQLISLEGDNAQQEAEYRGKALESEAHYRANALEKELVKYKNLDPRLLLALGFRELGQNAGKVGNLMITTEVLSALLNVKTDAKDGKRAESEI